MKRLPYILIIGVVLFFVGAWVYIAYIPASQEAFRSLEEENRMLRQELLALRNDPSRVVGNAYATLEAKTFSSYPFSNRSLIAVNAGRVHGVQIGMPVLVDGDILLGHIIRTGTYYSIVQTIFDPKWSMAVHVGEERTEGLFVGGVVPEVQLIEQEISLETGDEIRSASPLAPLGLRLGTIDEIHDDPAEAFQETTVVPAFRMGSVRLVSIITNFTEPNL